MTHIPVRAEAALRRYSLALAPLLIAGGLAGNYFKYPIFLNIDFLFGSIFAMLALQYFGLWRGIISAALIGAVTYFIWGHPYAILILTAEGAVVGSLVNRYKIGLVLADALYWLVLGMPLVYVFYHGVMDVPADSVNIVMIKQAVNGVANALLARMVFTGLAARTPRLTFPFRELVYNLLVLFALCPALMLLALASRSDFSATDKAIRKDLHQSSLQISQRLDVWVANRTPAIVRLAAMASALTPSQMQAHLEQALASDVNFQRIGLIDAAGIGTASSPPTDELAQSKLGKNHADQPFIPTLKQTLKPMLTEVVMSKAGIPKPIVTLVAPVVIEGQYGGYISGVLSLKQIREYLLESAKEDTLLYTLIDNSGNIILSNRTAKGMMTHFERGQGELSRLDDRVSQWVPEPARNAPVSERWRSSSYVAETPVGNWAEWRLILEQPVAPFQTMLNQRYADALTLLFVLLFVALALGEWLSRRITATTEQLSELTQDLPAKLQAGAQTVWPESTVLEQHRLIVNFKAMAATLATQFSANRALTESLEQRVSERTAELKASEFRWQFAVEGAGDGLWDWNLVDDSLLLTKRWKELLGYTEDDIGTDISEWEKRVHPEDTARVFAAVQSHLDGKTQNYETEHRVQCKDGSYKWILDRGVVVSRSVDGKPLRIIGTYSDITERKQAEDRVRASEKRSQAIIQTALDGFWLTDLQGQLLQVNDAYCRMSGYSDQELLGMRISDLEAKDESAATDAHMRAIIAQGSDRFETRHRRKDGSVLDIEVALQYQAVDGGRIVCFLSDITERKQAELARQESERRYRQMVENSPAVVYAYSIKNGGIYYSPKVLEVLGYTAQHLCANPFLWAQSIHPEDRAVLANAVAEFRQGVAFKIEYRIKNARDEWRWLFDQSSGSRKEDGDLIIEGLAMDITERKQIEQRECEAASRVERAMLGTVDAVSKMMDLRDPYTSGHERRVGEVAAAIGAEMGLDADAQRGLQVAGSLHDVGKITVPAEILSKPGKLTALEYQIIKAHAEQGYQVLKDVDFSWPVAEAVYQHHERMDGSGYPRGLKGKAIVLEARILAVADVIEAMSSHRPYRPGLGVDQALAEIEHGGGTTYDAHVADACVRLFREKGYSIPD